MAGWLSTSAVRAIDEDDRRTIVLPPVLARSRTQPRLRSGRSARPHRGVRVLALALIALGALALADAFITLVWQEPFSALYTTLRQADLRGALAREERAPATLRERHVL